MTTLAPGAVIGIIGGGQLGRMLSMAAAQLGYRCFIYAPAKTGPAADVCAKWVQGDYGDAAALATFAKSVDVVTFEFENVDTAPLRSISDNAPLYPPIDALEIGQDRIREKRFAADCGGRTADWAEVASRADLDVAIARIGTPAILKTTRFGYDGKGQARILKPTDADPAWDALSGGAPLILEKMIRFEHEFSLICARDQQGGIAFWDAPENVHKDGILATSTLPAHAKILEQVPAARALCRRIAERLDYVGVFAVEHCACDDVSADCEHAGQACAQPDDCSDCLVPSDPAALVDATVALLPPANVLVGAPLLVPVFAYGPGAEAFMGMYHNNTIFDKFMALFGF